MKEERLTDNYSRQDDMTEQLQKKTKQIDKQNIQWKNVEQRQTQTFNRNRNVTIKKLNAKRERSTEKKTK